VVFREKFVGWFDEGWEIEGETGVMVVKRA
jgi:hypothetical protein